MDLPVSQYEQDHILVVVLLELPCLQNGVRQQFLEQRRPPELQPRQHVPVRLHHPHHLEHISVVLVTVQRKTVVHPPVRVVVGHAHLGPEPVQRHQLVEIVVQQDFGHLVQPFLILRHFVGTHEMQRVGVLLDAVAGCEVDTGDQGELQPCRDVVSKLILDCPLDIPDVADSLLSSL